VVIGGTSWNAEGTQKSFHDDGVIFDGNAWQPGPTIGVALAEGAYASDGQALYLAGGLSQPDKSSDAVFQITMVGAGQSKVEKLSQLPAPISACSAAIFGNRLYVACGTLSPGKYTNQLWSLDISKPGAHWRKQSDLPGAGRGYPALVTCGSLIYLLGGLGDGDKSVHERTLSDAYQYDPATDQWKMLGNLPFGGYCWSAQPVDDSHILLAGRADGTIHNEIWLVHLPDLSTELLGHAVIQATCAPLVNVAPGKWWLIGGEPDSNKHRTDRVTVISLP
jgi:N-acetylneuraminic acid mutarotase